VPPIIQPLFGCEFVVEALQDEGLAGNIFKIFNNLELSVGAGLPM